MSGYDQLFSALDRSPITNRWGKVKPQPLAADTVTVFSAEPGAQYNHHPQITAWRGRLYATWSSGLIHEDFPGQQMVMAVSEDGGDSWSSPTVVADSTIGGQPGVVTNAGIHTFEDTMVAYYSYYRYDEQGMQLLEDYTDSRSPLPEQLDAHTGMRISRDGGETWSEPAGRIDRLTANLCPQRLQNGRLLLPGHATFFTTDDPLGLTGWERGSLPGVPAGYTDSPNGLVRRRPGHEAGRRGLLRGLLLPNGGRGNPHDAAHPDRRRPHLPQSLYPGGIGKPGSGEQLVQTDADAVLRLRQQMPVWNPARRPVFLYFLSAARLGPDAAGAGAQRGRRGF